jgi:hypothetical protein
MDGFRKFIRRRGAERWLLLEALAWLCWVKLLLAVAPFRWIAPRLGRQMTETSGAITPKESELALRISWAVQAVARYVPLGFVCLPQAISAKWMLRRRHLPTTLYLGLRHGEPYSRTAHAWLRAGDKILTGQAESYGHRAIATFGEDLS